MQNDENDDENFFKFFFNKNNIDFISNKPQDTFLYMQFFLDELKTYKYHR